MQAFLSMYMLAGNLPRPTPLEGGVRFQIGLGGGCSSVVM